MTQALAPLRDLARKGDCHILVTHHHTKMERGGGDGILGSVAIFGAVDSGIMMKKKDGNMRTIETQQRYGKDLPTTVISLSAENGQTSAQGELTAIQLKDVEEEVIEVLVEEQMTEPQIRKAVGGNGKLAGNAIRSLLVAGKLERTGEGRKGDPYLYAQKGISPLMELL